MMYKCVKRRPEEVLDGIVASLILQILFFLLFMLSVNMMS